MYSTDRVVLSGGVAALVARYMLFEQRPSQSAFIIPDQLFDNDEAVERFEAWARTHFRAKFSLAQAARGMGASKRTLAPKLQSVMGKTPLQYVQQLRVERAVQMLQSKTHSLDSIAEAVGYLDDVTLRNLLRKQKGRGVRALRQLG